jgi:hypothetical protein
LIGRIKVKNSKCHENQGHDFAIAALEEIAIAGVDVLQSFLLRGHRTRIGRHPRNAVSIDSRAIARDLAEIVESSGRFFLEKIRNGNILQVNGQTIDERVELQNGDEIAVYHPMMAEPGVRLRFRRLDLPQNPT